MNRLLILCLICLTGCGPLTPSIPKSGLCSIPSEYMSRYNSVQEHIDSWTEVQTIMGEAPTSIEGDTQTYVHCKAMSFTFSGSVLVSKRIE